MNLFPFLFMYPFQKNNKDSKRKKVAGKFVNNLPVKNNRIHEKVMQIPTSNASLLLNISFISKYEDATSPVESRTTKNLIAFSPKLNLKNSEVKKGHIKPRR